MSGISLGKESTLIKIATLKTVNKVSNNIKDVNAQDTIKVMTWNIRFGVARLRFFGDGCGDRVIMTKSEVIEGLEGIAEKINQENPDILFIQEADVQSKKTGYINQAQWLLDHTDFNYGAYGSMWESQIILADGLGRVNTGNLILSKCSLLSFFLSIGSSSLSINSLRGSM